MRDRQRCVQRVLRDDDVELKGVGLKSEPVGVELARRGVDLVALLEEVVADGDFEARNSGRRVLFETATSRSVRGNPDLPRSAIENVVRNAIRHAASGTAVVVTLETAAERIRISVRDHGDGLPGDLLEHLFAPFCSTSGGAGLRLAIAERVVRMHHGSIAATNAEGGGLRIDMELDAGRSENSAHLSS